MTTTPESFVKHPVEAYPIEVDFTSKGPTGSSLASGVWDAVDESDDSDVTGTVLVSPTATIMGELALGEVQAGVHGGRYRLGVTVTFDTGAVLHDDVLMIVHNRG